MRPRVAAGRRAPSLVALSAWILVGLAACGGGRSQRDGGPAPPARLPSRGAAIDLRRSPELQEIAVLEDARSTGGGRLQELLASDAAPVRERAALALGRMPFPEHGDEVTQPLCRALGDAEPGVRATAAFALGQRGDPGAAGVLLASWNDPDPAVRAEVVTAVGRLDTPGTRPEVLRALRDPEPEVRIRALRATALWEPGGEGADEVDAALVDAISAHPVSAAAERDPGIVWNALYALQRRSAEKGRGAFLEHLEGGEPLQRIFSAKGLARIEPTAEGTRALTAALDDRDWRVVCEAARGLGASNDDAAVAPLLAAVDHPVAHVRRTALEALSNFPARARDIVPQGWRGTQDLSSSVRAAAYELLARLLEPDEAARALEAEVDGRDPVVRAGIARAASRLPSFRALPVLERLARDAELAVAGAALESLGRLRTPQARELLLEFLDQSDNGLRLAAVIALRENGRASDVPRLRRVLETSTGDVASELAFNVLRNLGEIGGDEAQRVVADALAHDAPYVRQVASEVLETDFGVRAESPPRAGRADDATVPQPGRDFPAWRTNPIVEIATSRGSMFFELFPAEAPLHVHSFLELAERDHYDGLVFHRVEPDFVVQGGDYRGDGNGGLSWRGGPLRHEFGRRTYVRGSLGTPRNEDPDSGGSQIFVTHRPTPHLDHRYTIFGELRAGGDALDRLEVGDRILDVRVVR